MVLRSPTQTTTLVAVIDLSGDGTDMHQTEPVLTLEHVVWKWQPELGDKISWSI